MSCHTRSVPKSLGRPNDAPHLTAFHEPYRLALCQPDFAAFCQPLLIAVYRSNVVAFQESNWLAVVGPHVFAVCEPLFIAVYRPIQEPNWLALCQPDFVALCQPLFIAVYRSNVVAHEGPNWLAFVEPHRTPYCTAFRNGADQSAVGQPNGSTHYFTHLEPLGIADRQPDPRSDAIANCSANQQPRSSRMHLPVDRLSDGVALNLPHARANGRIHFAANGRADEVALEEPNAQPNGCRHISADGRADGFSFGTSDLIALEEPK
ncbi:hypothetical protein ACHAXT_002019, partial [Thalassiosira profunda]